MNRRLRRRRRGSVVAERRRTRRRGVLLRGADLAARHVPVRRPRQSRVVRAGRGSAGADFTDASGSVGPADQAGGGRRQADHRAEPGARRAEPCSRGAVFLRSASRQLRLRDWQSGPRLRARAGDGRVAAVAHLARERRGDAVPQQHRRLHLPQPDQRRGSSRSVTARFEDDGGIPCDRVRRLRTACCRVSRRTPTSGCPTAFDLELGLDYVRGLARRTAASRCPVFRRCAGASA